MFAVNEPCFEEGGIHLKLYPFAFITLGVYVLGFPGFVIYKLWRNRLLVQEDQLLRAQWLGDQRIENKHAYSFRKRYKRLYKNFKPEYWYWIIIQIARKFILAFTSLMFIRNPGFQMSIVLLTVFVAYTVQVKFQPYMSVSEVQSVVKEYEKQAKNDYEKWVDRVLQTGDRYIKKPEKWLVWREMQDALENLSATSAATTTMDARQRTPRNTSATANFIFNYNTVESFLLACAVIITLGGVMFESGQLDSPSFATHREALGMLLVVIIIVSVLFAGTVIAYDTLLMCKPDLCQRRKDKSPKKLDDDDDKIVIENSQLLRGLQKIKGNQLPDVCDDPLLWDRIRERYTELESSLDELQSAGGLLNKSRRGSIMRRAAVRTKKVKKEYNQLQSNKAAEWNNYTDPSTGMDY